MTLLDEPIRLSFQLRQDEFAQASAGKVTDKLATESNAIALSWVLFGLALIGPGISRFLDHRDAGSYDGLPALSRAQLAIALAPATFAGLWIAAVYWKHLFGRSVKPWQSTGNSRGMKPEAVIRIALGIVLALVLTNLSLIVGTLGFSRRAYEDAIARPEFLVALWATLLTIVPMLIVTGASRARTVTRTWDSQPTLQRVVELTATPSGLTVEAQTYTTVYSWRHFQGYRETALALVLHSSLLLIEIVPKRAFVSEEQFEAFCSLLQNNIPEGTFFPRAKGFAVTPLASSPA